MRKNIKQSTVIKTTALLFLTICACYGENNGDDYCSRSAEAINQQVRDIQREHEERRRQRQIDRIEKKLEEQD